MSKFANIARATKKQSDQEVNTAFQNAPEEDLKSSSVDIPEDNDGDKSASKMAKVVKLAMNTDQAKKNFKEKSIVRKRLKSRMRQIVQERLTVKQIFKRYVETSTLHGFCYVCSDTFFIRRFLWALLMISGACYFLVKLRLGIIDFFSYPFSTITTVDYVGELIFPAISFCTTNSFLYSQVEQSPLKTLSHGNRLPLDRLWKDPGFDVPGDELVDALYNTSLSMNKMLKYCDWLSRDTSHPEVLPHACGAVNFTSYINYKGQVCHTLNSGKVEHRLLKVAAEGLTYGYELMFDIHTSEVIKSFDYTGMQVMIHDQSFPPQMSDGQMIPPGFKTFFKMRTVEYVSLPPPFATECGTKELKYYDIYNQRLCILESLTDYTGKKCGCRDLFMPDNGLPFCSLQTLFSCMYPARESFSEFEMRKECPTDCVSTTYTFDKSESRFLHNPPTALSPRLLGNTQFQKGLTEEHHITILSKKMNSTDLDLYIENNIVNVIFYFGEIQKDINTQKETFGFFKFLGNMGGEFGLMLGASLLTFVEFMDLFIFLIYHQLLRLQNRNKTSDHFSKKRREKTAAKA